jgi:hypothetical protein
MKEDIKAKWVEALRSNNYPQTTQQLRDHKGFCCMGVLCDIVEPEHWAGWEHNGRAMLPDETWTSELDIPRAIVSELAYLNDTKKWTFSQIAKFIEDTL